jgi:hypothetical protein
MEMATVENLGWKVIAHFEQRYVFLDKRYPVRRIVGMMMTAVIKATTYHGTS